MPAGGLSRGGIRSDGLIWAARQLDSLNIEHFSFGIEMRNAISLWLAR
jgi:hypothetical protein